MGDVRLLVKRLGLIGEAPQVESKACEFMRLASAKLGPNAMGSAAICKAAVCVDLACMTLQVPANTAALIQCCGTSQLVYKNARAMLQKVLSVRSGASPRDLCIQFGCARLDLSVRSALAAYKQRLLESMLPSDRTQADLSSPVFLAASFFLVARKHRVKVAKDRLLASLGLTSREFHRTVASAAELMPELAEKSGSGGARRKKKAPKRERPSSAGSEDGGESGSEDAAEWGPSGSQQAMGDVCMLPAEDDVAGEEEEEADNEEKENEAEMRMTRSSSLKRRKSGSLVTENMLRQAVLEFSGAAEKPRAVSPTTFRT